MAAYILGTIALFAPAAATAQNSSGVRIQPSLIEERALPGETFSGTIAITNLDSEAKTFYLSKRNIKGISEEGVPSFSAEGEETPYDMSSWIRLAASSALIPGKGTREVRFTVAVPVGASPGGHFAGIFASFAPPAPKETGIGVGYQVGTIINLRVVGDAHEEAGIREFRTDRKFYVAPPVKFLTRIENRGNVLVRPRGPLEVFDWFGKKVASLRVNDEGAGVFPSSDRSFETVWDGEGLMFGRYRTTMSLVYGDQEKNTISESASFWIVPLKPALWTFSILALGVLASVFLVRRHIQKKLRELGGGGALRVHRNAKGPSWFSLFLGFCFAFAVFFLAFLFFFLA